MRWNSMWGPHVQDLLFVHTLFVEFIAFSKANSITLWDCNTNGSTITYTWTELDINKFHCSMWSSANMYYETSSLNWSSAILTVDRGSNTNSLKRVISRENIPKGNSSSNHWFSGLNSLLVSGRNKSSKNDPIDGVEVPLPSKLSKPLAHPAVKLRNMSRLWSNTVGPRSGRGIEDQRSCVVWIYPLNQDAIVTTRMTLTFFGREFL